METEYQNWLVSEQLEDTPERKEGFEAGWNYAWDLAQEKIKRALE